MNVNDAIAQTTEAIDMNGAIMGLITPVVEYTRDASHIMADNLGSDHEATTAFALATEKASDVISRCAHLGADLEALQQYLASIQ